LPFAVPRIVRFASSELALWAGLYGAYLALRGVSIAQPDVAFEHASTLIDFEQGAGLFHEKSLQSALAWGHDFFSAYYMLAFAPLLATTLVWMGLRHQDRYRELRTLLLLSLGIAAIFYVLYPTAPPRLVPGLGIADTVGLSSHDTGSFGGVRFNPYAAMPSMHVGWSLLVGSFGSRALRGSALRWVFALHPVVMAVAGTATGNHYFLDSAAGVAVVLSALVAIRLFNRKER
jgi:PAP2 superfamily